MNDVDWRAVYTDTRRAATLGSGVLQLSLLVSVAILSMSRAFIALVLFCVLPACIGCSRQHATIDAALVARNNEGVGLMRRYDFDGARKVFAALAADHPDVRDVRVNLAIATLNRQGEGDSAAAEELLATVVAKEPDALRAQYCLGLALLHDGRPQEALPHLQRAADASPGDAVAAYYVAQSLSQSGSYQQALQWFERAARIDPRLRSAYYGAFQMLQRLGRADEAQQQLATFRNLETNPQSRLIEFKYTRMGPLAEATTIDSEPRVKAVHPNGAVFASGAPLVLPVGRDAAPWHAFGPGETASLTAADVDGDGRIDLFVAGGVGDGTSRRSALFLNRGDGRFEAVASHPLAAVNARAALWGDFDNDGLTDVFFCRAGGNQLWRQHPAGTWTDVTNAARIPQSSAGCTDGAMFDADHDGDLDLLLISEDGDDLLNNNGDGTFRSIALPTGIGRDRRPSRTIALADLDADRDADIVIVKTSPPHEVFVNDRGWRYRRDPAFSAFEQSAVFAVVAGDLDSDGAVELYASDDQGVVRWARGPSAWVPHRVDGTAALARSTQLALEDTDGDGRLDLIGTRAGGGLEVMAITGDRATSLFSAARPALAGWTTTLLDDVHGAAIAGIPSGDSSGALLWRPGPGRWPFATIALTGRDAGSDQLRSNVSGIGVSLDARADSRWTSVSTLRPQSGVGQSLRPTAVGTGDQAGLDFVSLTWSDGVLQTELAIAPGTLHKIGEIERQLSSCPVLFAYDGRQFSFVTDLLGVGGMGTPSFGGPRAQSGTPSLAPDPPRPRENLLLPIDAIAARDGRFELRIDEPMEEVAYIDAARLVAYDLPPGWQVALDERKDVGRPAATGAARFFRRELLPERAVDDEGRDETSAVRAADGVAADPGRVDPRFIGRTAEHTLTLQFDAALDEVAGHPFLVADGWIEYPYAQTLFGAWQAGAPYRAPTIEARGAGGAWTPILVEFGYPAGMPRRMSVPLGALPRGTRELRITTTQEVYWDRLAVAFAEPQTNVVRRELPLVTARLTESGFARRTVAAGRRPSYDYGHRAPLWDARRQRGWYTAEGDILELLNREDGALAIFGPGEEVQLTFLAPIDGPPAGWTRRYVLEARGWCKDMDLYTKDGDTVEPLPSPPHLSAASAALNRKYNTRAY